MITMRKPCLCGCEVGTISTKNGQDCVYCQCCKKWQYNAPKTETGRAQRTVSTTHEAIKPKVRSRVIERANGRCERCGRPAHFTQTGLHVGHIVSVEAGHQYGLSDAEINSEENLIAECDECNLGHSSDALPIRMFMAILKKRLEQGA
jgi:5-methylcytosine-specific restriction endonuclease McrA